MRQTHVTTAWQPWPLNSKVCNLGHNDLLLRLGLISSFVGLDLHLLLLFLGSLAIRVWSFFTVCFSPLFFSDLSCLYGPIKLLNSVFIQVHLILKNILPRLEESSLECFSVVYGRKSYGQRLETRIIVFHENPRWVGYPPPASVCPPRTGRRQSLLVFSTPTPVVNVNTDRVKTVTFWEPQLGRRSIQGRIEWLAHIWRAFCEISCFRLDLLPSSFSLFAWLSLPSLSLDDA